MGSCISHGSESRSYANQNAANRPIQRLRPSNMHDSSDITSNTQSQSTQTLGLNKRVTIFKRRPSTFGGKCISNFKNCTGDSASNDMWISDDEEAGDLVRRRNGEHISNAYDNGSDDFDDDDDSIVSYNRRLRHVSDIVSDILQAIRMVVINK
jgi:hypothetical protein